MENTLLCQVSMGQEDDWKSLYEIAFPDDERMPVQEIRQLLSIGKMQMHKTLNKNNELLGFSLLFLPGSDFVLLSYIATDPTKRSGGVGSKHLKRLIDMLKQQFPSHLGLFLEIESTKEAGLDAATMQLRQRRLAFYQRLGAKRLCKNYIMPTLMPGGKERPGELLWIEFGSPVDDNGVEHVIRDIYSLAYNLPLTDPSVQQVLSQFVIKVPKPAVTSPAPATPSAPASPSSDAKAQSSESPSSPAVTSPSGGNVPANKTVTDK
jgi:GNAT superfamily N-acetyltransferase